MQREVKDIRITQTTLRHRSVNSTMKYTGVADERMQAAVLSLRPAIAELVGMNVQIAYSRLQQRRLSGS